MSEPFPSDRILDATRLLCPMPVIRVQDATATMTPGQILMVKCSDPGTRHDIPAWCQIHGHHILGEDSNDDELLFWIRVGAPS